MHACAVNKAPGPTASMAVKFDPEQLRRFPRGSGVDWDDVFVGDETDRLAVEPNSSACRIETGVQKVLVPGSQP